MMEEELKNLQEWLKKASTYELPSFKELPAVPLYMEQVTAYINKTLAPMSPKDNEILTSYMVNNYVKAKIIKEPNKKKYNEEHLGYLLAISALKNSLTMAELSHLIALDADITQDKSVLYRFFTMMTKDVGQNTISLAQQRVNRFAEEYEKNKEKDPEGAERHLIDSLGLIALRMSIRASFERIVAEALLTAIEKGSSGKTFEEENSKKNHKVMKHSAIASDKEAESIASAKQKIIKEQRKDEKRKENEARRKEKEEQQKLAREQKEQEEKLTKEVKK